MFPDIPQGREVGEGCLCERYICQVCCTVEVGWLLSWQALALTNVPARLLGTGTGASTNPD